MDIHQLFAILAILCFLASAVDLDRGKGISVGLIFFVCAVAF